jgi:hypothetical protein
MWLTHNGPHTLDVLTLDVHTVHAARAVRGARCAHCALCTVRAVCTVCAVCAVCTVCALDEGWNSGWGPAGGDRPGRGCGLLLANQEVLFQDNSPTIRVSDNTVFRVPELCDPSSRGNDQGPMDGPHSCSGPINCPIPPPDHVPLRGNHYWTSLQSIYHHYTLYSTQSVYHHWRRSEEPESGPFVCLQRLGTGFPMGNGLELARHHAFDTRQ